MIEVLRLAQEKVLKSFLFRAERMSLLDGLGDKLTRIVFTENIFIVDSGIFV